MKANKQPAIMRGLAEINLTSLVDVSLTLVIIFMVSSPLVMQSGIIVNAPALQRAQKTAQASEFKAEVYLKTDGTIDLNGRAVAASAFADSLRNLLAASKSKTVVISADGNVVNDQVIATLDQAKQCGAEQLSIVRRKH